MRHTYRCPVRWADLDLQGHVNNVALADYLQEARVDMMRTESLLSRAGGLDEGVVVVGHRVTYLAPIRFSRRPLVIESWVTEIRAASFTIGYVVFDEVDGVRTECARATTVLAPYLFGSQMPRRLTPSERAGLEPFLEPGEAGRTGTAKAAELDHDTAAHFPIRVRFSDVDVYGHVNNVRYFEYFQEARVALLESLTAETAPGGLVVAQADVDYRAQLGFRPAPYDVWSRIAAVGTTSYTIEAELTDGDLVASRCRAVVVCVDPVTGRPTRPPAGFRAALLAACR